MYRTSIALLAFLVGLILPALSYAEVCVEPATCTWVVDTTYPPSDVYNWNLCNVTPPTTEPECSVPASYLSVSYFGWDDQLGYCTGQTLGMVSACVVPEPDEPETCSNDTKDGDEDGVDCGGSCTNPCNAASCPDGYATITNDGVTWCSSEGVPSINGGCPDSYPNASVDGSTCFPDETAPEPQLSYVPDNPELPAYIPSVPPADPWTSSDTASSATSTTSGSNPDGSTFETTSTDTTSIDPATSTTIVTSAESTTTTYVDNSTTIVNNNQTTIIYEDGSNITTDSTSTETYDPDGNLVSESGSVSITESEEGAGSYGNIPSKSAGGIDFTPIYNLQTTLADRFPISLVTTFTSLLDDWVVPVAAPSWTISFPNPIGSDISIVIDLVHMDYIASIIRQMLSMFFVVSGFYLVYKRWV